MKRQLFNDPNSLRELTPREKMVLYAAKDRAPLAEIAESLNIPPSLVTRHLTNIVIKIGVNNANLAHDLQYAYNLEINR